MPQVSIIVYVKNISCFLPRCLDSIINQTLRDIEIIVFEDGSTDDSPAICDDYGAKYDNVNVIHTENRGLPYAYDTAVSMARGRYVLFVKSDDFIAPNTCEIMYENANRHDSDIVKCGIVQYSERDGKVLALNWERWILSEVAAQDTPFALTDHKILLTYHGAVWGTLFKSDFIRTLKFSEGCGNCFQEYAFIIKSMICAKRISVVLDELYFWNIDPTDFFNPRGNPVLLQSMEPFVASKKWMLEKGCFEEYIPEFYKAVMLITMGFYEYISDDLKPEYFKVLQQFYSDMNMFVFPRVTSLFSRTQVQFLIDIMKDN